MEKLYKAQTRILFHAHIKLKIPYVYDEQVFDELYKVLIQVDRKLNSYTKGSYIDTINKYAGSFVEVDDETIALLEKVLRLSSFFEGMYDITVMPLIRVWGFYKKRKRLPSPEDINRAKALVDYRNIEINGNKVKIAKGQEIITGSFLKAYAVDKLKAEMHGMGMTDAIINAGGSSIAAINDSSHPVWEVIVREPDSKKEIYRVDITNQAFSTSEQYVSYITINGERYGHILNPKTGFPATNKQVGIISENCLEGDILSTGLFNEDSHSFLNKIKELSAYYTVEGFLIDEYNRVTETKGFRKNEYNKCANK